MEEFNLRNLDIAGFCFSPASDEEIFDFLLDFYNKIIILMEKKKPFSIIGIFIKKDLFEKLNGYDESIKLSEDCDLGRRAINFGKFGIIKSVKIFISDRRFKKDGWMTTVMKYVLSEMHTSFIGPIKTDIFKYKFDHYDKDKS